MKPVSEETKMKFVATGHIRIPFPHQTQYTGAGRSQGGTAIALDLSRMREYTHDHPDVNHQQDVVCLAPFNRSGHVGECKVNIPTECVPAAIEALQKLASPKSKGGTITLLKLKITNGEYHYFSYGLYRNATSKDLKKAVGQFYGGGRWGGKVCYSHNRHVAVELYDKKKVTEAEAEVLNRLDVACFMLI